MPELPPVAFFSYAHADDQTEGGFLSGLHRQLCEELTDQNKPLLVRLFLRLFRRPFQIFMDRTSIEWGQQWEERIYKSVDGSTFFIAVLTRKYFERPMCRNELDDFLQRERQIGRNDLVLSVLYKDCPQLENPEGYPEEVAKLARELLRRQWEDVRPLQGRPLDDPIWRAQVKELARKLRRAYARTRRVAWWQRRLPWAFAAVAAAVAAAAVLTDASPPPPPESIVVASRWNAQERSSFQNVISAFEEDSGDRVVVEYVTTDEDAAEFVERRRQDGELPDVMLIPSPGLMEELVHDRELRPLEEVVGSEVDTRYDEFWRDLATVDGTLYGVWFKAAHKSTFWYNAEVFDDAEVSPPQTWEELRDAAGEIAETGTRPFAVGARGDDDWVLTDWFENVYLRTAGEDLYHQLTAREIPWTHDSVAEALHTLADVLGNDEWIAGGIESMTSDSFPDSVEQAFGEPPDAAMLYEGDFAASFIRDRTNKVIGEDADVFPFPSVGGSQRAVVVGGDMAVLLSDDQVAKNLIGYLATREAFEEWARDGGALSPNKDVEASIYPDDVTREAAAEILNPDVVRVFDLSDLTPPAFGGKPAEGMRETLGAFLTGLTDDQVTREELIAETQRGLERAARDAERS